MAIKIRKGYDYKSGRTVETVVAELAKAHARSVVSGVTSLTDSSGGTGGSALLAASTALVNSANSGTNLASKATAESALTTVKDALLELYTKANAYAVLLDRGAVTYNGGGTAADGTVGAITVATTAATTGAQAASVNANLASINTSFYVLGVLTNKLLKSCGYATIDLSALKGNTYVNTIGALTIDAGTAADPGVTKAALDAELVKLRTNVATIATKLNSLNDGLGSALVVFI